MKLTFLALLTFTTSVFGQQGGTGPYKAWYKTDPGLPNHTLYLPVPEQHPSSMPVLLWGNGACSANGLDFQKFLTNVASQGVLVIANGRPNGQGSSNNQWMHDALRWVREKAGKEWPYERVDASRVAAAGMSCGGVEAYEMRNSGVVGIGIFNSGLLDQGNRARIMSEVKAPIFYFMGGQSDIAYNNVSFLSFLYWRLSVRMILTNSRLNKITDLFQTTLLPGRVTSTSAMAELIKMLRVASLALRLSTGSSGFSDRMSAEGVTSLKVAPREMDGRLSQRDWT